ncbi:MAG: thioether cross-link-forming SCIFF peptide maturase [Oscillospiraceae bacterium]
MIHKYSLMGHYIVLDVNSGAVHLVEEPFYRLLDYVEDVPQEDCPERALEELSGDISRAELLEAWGEIVELYKGGYLYSPDDYDAFAEKMVLSPVKAMCLNVSHDCNLRCQYCFAGKGDYDQGRMVMNAETGKRAIDFLLEQSGDREFLELDFFGGEPLMNFGVVKEVVEYARSKEREYGKTFRFTITTNGMLLDDEKIDYINREMSNVVLSLDGRREVNDRVRTRVDGSGCYDRVLGAFQKLVESRGEKEYYVRGTFTKYNKDFSDDVYALNEAGFDQISVEPVVADPKEPYALTEEDLPEIFREYERLSERLVKSRKQGKYFNFFHFMIDLEQGPCVIKRLRGCGCGNEYVAVTPDGNIYPCHQFIGHEDWKMGSLYDGSFDLGMKERFSKTSVYNKPDCRDCWAKFYCSGGCNANNMQYMGDILTSHTLSCETEKKRVECAIAIQAELLDE